MSQSMSYPGLPLSCQVCGAPAVQFTTANGLYPGQPGGRYCFEHAPIKMVMQSAEPPAVVMQSDDDEPCGRCGGPGPLDAQGMCWHCR